MPVSTRHVYRSANGDRWLQIIDTVSGEKIVRHEANQSPGGHGTDTGVQEFLDWRVPASIRRFTGVIDEPTVADSGH
jgi:hypothetical protein